MLPVAPERQPSAYSLPERSEASILQQAGGADAVELGEDDDDDGRSDSSSRSDRSEEAAGLVSRMSDEEDRAFRRAKYEGGGRRGSAIGAAISSSAYRNSDDSDRGTVVSQSLGTSDKRSNHDCRPSSSSSLGLGQTSTERDHSIAPSDVRDGLFRDRAVDTQRPRRSKAQRRGTVFRVWEISREALPTLLLSLVSLVLSGELLIHLSKWPVFSKVDKLFILIPILLNLKGNLEGNLSLRMSTSANIGELDVRRTRETLIFGNLALLQVQALIVSLFAGILSFILGLGTGAEPAKQGQSVAIRRFMPRRVIHHHPTTDPSLKMRNGYFEFVLVIATAMLSASISSAILGTFMCALVVVTRQRGGNPDNIASPLSGSLGDLLTLTLLGLLSSFMVRFEGTILATMILLGLAFVCLAFFLIAYRNAYVRELLSSGWIPLVVAMFISSGAGVVLDTFVSKFEGFALLVPVITGLPGACAAIFVSRTSTALHGGNSVNRLTSGRAFRRPSGRPTSGLLATLARFTPRWLAGLGGPTEGWTVPSTIFSLGFFVVMSFIAFVRLTGQMSFGLPFFFALAVAGTVQIACSLAIAHILTLLLWRYDYDPDIYCLPYVSSIVDVIGQVILVTAYYVAIGFGDTITAAVNEGRK